MKKDFSLESILEITKDRKPDFNNLLKVLRRETPGRPTLFEFHLNTPLELRGAGMAKENEGVDEYTKMNIASYRAFGYDFTKLELDALEFKIDEDNHKSLKTASANTGFVITERTSFEAYKWDKPLEKYDGKIERVEKYLPDGMKFMVCSPCGLLENVIRLVGYENLCYMLIDDPDLAGDIFNKVGQSLYDYYSIAVKYDSVGFLMANDDWGFNTQTMISPADLRKYVFPWYKKIAKLAHDAEKPIVLHSCGMLDAVYDDISDDIGIDGKHSYEDNICPVEDMYDRLKDKIAVLGGIDVDFVCRSAPEEIYKRSRDMLIKTGCRGYALGTGNSVPYYVPDENYLAMIAAALYE